MVWPTWAVQTKTARSAQFFNHYQQLIMKHIPSFLNSIVVAGALLAAGTPAAQAAVVNGGFESGLSGWSTWGDASIQAGAPFGDSQLVLTNAGLDADEFDLSGSLIGPFNRSGNAALAVGVPGGLETQGGFALGAFDPVGPAGDAAIEGSLAQQTFTAGAGDTLRFVWNFGTRDTFADYAFVAINGQVIRLAGVPEARLAVPDALLASSGDNLFETGLQSFSYTFATAGAQTLTFGVVDVADAAVLSSLFVDQVQLTAAPTNQVPEPASAALLLLGLALAAQARGRRVG
jgi:PEP-CTERM motif